MFVFSVKDVWQFLRSRVGLEPEHETNQRSQGPDREHHCRKNHRGCHSNLSRAQGHAQDADGPHGRHRDDH